MPTSIAASIALIVSWCVMSLSPQNVSHAQQLDSILKATNGYQGWIHVHCDLKQSDFMGDDSKTTALTYHVNNTDGSMIAETTVDGESRILYLKPQQQTIIHYNQKDNQIVNSSLNKHVAHNMKKLVAFAMPVTIENFLEALDLKKRPELVTIQRSNEGEHERFEIDFSPEAQTFLKEKGGSPGFKKAVLWVDPRSKLIQRERFITSQGTLVMRLTYGKPDIGDIYDLGVPRDTPVVDRRPQGQLAEVLDRVERRYEKGLGDYVAILSRTNVAAPGEFEDGLGAVHLLARRGKDWLSIVYSLGKQNETTRRTAIDFPEGWPLPDVDETIAQLKTAKPYSYVVVAGGGGWRGMVDSSSGEAIYPGTFSGRNVQTIPSEAARNSLEGHIWPTRTRFFQSGLGSQSTLEPVDDPQHAGLIGVRGTFRTLLTADTFTDHVSTWWIDPQHDDLLKESVVEMTNPDRGTMVFRKSVSKFEKLGNGQWYPKEWTQISGNVSDGEIQDKSPRQFQLQIFPGKTLDESWYTNPLERLNIKKGELK